MKKKEMMNIINPNAAGIDIGSKSHFVAVGQKEDQIKNLPNNKGLHMFLFTLYTIRTQL